MKDLKFISRPRYYKKRDRNYEVIYRTQTIGNLLYHDRTHSSVHWYYSLGLVQDIRLWKLDENLIEYLKISELPFETATSFPFQNAKALIQHILTAKPDFSQIPTPESYPERRRFLIHLAHEYRQNQKNQSSLPRTRQ